MKFVILNTDYHSFLHWLYSLHPGLEKQSYAEQMRVRNESLFGVADFYSSNLCKLGYDAYDIHINNEFMQKAWADEQGLKFDTGYPRQLRLRKKIIPWISRTEKQRWYYDILAAQIKHYQPDILLNQAMDDVSSSFLKEIKPNVKLLIGQYAAGKPSPTEDFCRYDFVISSFPPTIEYFRKKGIPVELSRLGFEPRVLSYLKDEEQTFEVSFVGSFQGIHSSRAALLKRLSEEISQLKIWSPDINHLPSLSSIRRCYMGQAWGQKMYQILHKSKITLNHHGDIPPYANNMRLYEATGVGTLLITDYKVNLGEIFEAGKEIIIYHNPEECIELIKYYLERHNERKVIAQAGQQRTLNEHTYFQRVQELVEIIHKYI